MMMIHDDNGSFRAQSTTARTPQRDGLRSLLGRNAIRIELRGVVILEQANGNSDMPWHTEAVDTISILDPGESSKFRRPGS